uniref:Ribosomal protein L15 n=1 Tax=Oryza rufipogon TaxID=4529 RepID=A0A0E0PWW7_ORYRU
MGAYRCVSELWRRKQSDVMTFVQRVRCWDHRRQPAIGRPTRPDKARRLGDKAKQGYVVLPCPSRRGGRKRPVPKGIVYSKPKHQGITQLKFQRNKRSVAEELLGASWVDSGCSPPTGSSLWMLLTAPSATTPRINWLCKPVHKHGELHGLTSAGNKYRGLRGKGHTHHKARPSSPRATWKRNQTVSLRRYR